MMPASRLPWLHTFACVSSDVAKWRGVFLSFLCVLTIHVCVSVCVSTVWAEQSSVPTHRDDTEPGLNTDKPVFQPVGTYLHSISPRTSGRPKELHYQVRWFPLERWQELMRRYPKGWMVTYQEWQKTWIQLRRWLLHPAQWAEHLSVQWQYLTVSGRWEQPFLHLKLTFALRILQPGWHQLGLPLQHVRVSAFDFQGMVGSVVRSGDGFSVWIKGPAEGHLVVSGATLVSKSPRGHVVDFAVPTAAVSSVSLQLPAHQEVQYLSSGLQTKTSHTHTKVWGGGEKQGKVRFVFRKAEIGTPKQAAWSGVVDTAYHLQPNLQWLNSHIQISPKISMSRQFLLKIPVGFRLMDFSAPKHVDFVYKEKESTVLVRVLHWNPQEVLSLRVQCVRQGSVGDDFLASPVVLAGAYAQTGMLKVLVDRRLRHKLQNLRDVRQVPVVGKHKTPVLDVYLQFRYWRGDSAVRLGIRPVVPVLAANYNLVLQVLPRQVRVHIRCQLQVKEGSVYRISGRLSPEWKLFSILDEKGREMTYGHRDDRWWLLLPKPWIAGQTRTLRLVALRQVVLPTQGSVRFQLPGLQLDSVQPEKGRLSMVWPWFYRLDMEKSASLAPLFGAPRSHAQHRTYRLDWNLNRFDLRETATLSRRIPQVEVSAVTHYQWRADWMQGTISLQGEIREAGVRQLSMTLSNWPKSLEPPHVSVTNNRVVKLESHALPSGKTRWDLHLAREHFGKIALSAQFQWQKPSSVADMSLPLVRAAGTRLLRSYTTVAVADNTEIVATTQGLDAVDPLEIPKQGTPTRKIQAPLYAYRTISSASSSLQLRLQTHPIQKLQDVVIRSMTVQASAMTLGRLQMKVAYDLWTRGNGYLALTLPEHAELWSVLRNHKGIKPLLHKKEIRVHIAEHKTRRGRHHVSIVYELQKAVLPKTRGALQLLLPQVDAPIQHSTISVYLPKSYRPIQIDASFPAYDTVQPRAFLAKVFVSLRRQMGLFSMAFWAGVFLVFWLLRFWLWRWAVAIMLFFMRVIYRWRKAILYTTVVVGGLGILVVGMVFLIPARRYYAPSYKKYPQQEAQKDYGGVVRTPSSGPVSSTTPAPVVPPAIMDQKQAAPGGGQYWGDGKGRGSRRNEFALRLKAEKKTDMPQQMAPAEPVSPSVVTKQAPEKPKLMPPPDVTDKEGDLSRHSRLSRKTTTLSTEDESNDANLGKDRWTGKIGGKRGPWGHVSPEPQGQKVPKKMPPILTPKPATKLLAESGLRDTDTRMVEGIRSLQFSPPTQGWQVGVFGLGVPSTLRIAVYQESWLRFWLLSCVLLSFLVWLGLGMILPERRFLLFWGGILVTGTGATLLQGIWLLLANTVQLGILGAGMMYLLFSVLSSIRNAQGLYAGMVALFLYVGLSGASLVHAEPRETRETRDISQILPGKIQKTQLVSWGGISADDSGISVAEQSCRDMFLRQLVLERGTSFPLYIPYPSRTKVGTNSARLKAGALSPQQPVFVPGGWWKWVQAGKLASCRRLPKYATRWMNAHYQATVDEHHQVRGTATYTIHLLRAGWHPVGLGLGGMQVLEARHQNLPVSLRYHEHQYQILLQGPGIHQVHVTYQAANVRERRELQWQFASAVGSTLQLQIKGAWQIQGHGADTSGALLQRSEKETRWFAMIGNTPSLRITWQPLRQEGQVEEEMASLSTLTVVSLSEPLLRVRSRFQFSGRYRRNDRYRFVLPSGILLEKVTGVSLRNWYTEETTPQQQVLVVLLEQPVLQATLELQYVRLRQKKTEVMDVPLVEPQGIGRRSGWLGIRSSRALSWSLRQSRYLEKRQLSDWKEDAQSWGGVVEEAFAYQHRPVVQVAVRPVPDQRNIDLQHQLILAKRHIRLESKLQIQGDGLPKFALSWLVSPSLAIQSIRTLQGAPVRQMWFAGESHGLRRLWIEFTRPIASTQSLQLIAVMPMTGTALTLPVVVPERKKHWQGTLVVRTLGDMAVSTENLEHLDSVELTQISSAASMVRDARLFHARLAYRFQQPYQGKLSWQSILSKRKCRVWLHAHIGQNQQQVRAVLSFTASEAGVQSFSFSMPNTFAERIEWVQQGPLHLETSTVAGGRTLYRFKGIRLQKSLQISFRLRWRLPLSQDVTIPSIRPEDVAQTETLLAISTPTSIQLNMKKAKQQALFTLDPDEFPMESMDQWIPTVEDASEHDEIPIVATYRTRQLDWSLQVPREVLQTDVAIHTQVETARLDTVVSREGELWTQAQYTLRSAGLQFLHIKLPVGARLWDVRVAGGSIRPAQKQGVILIPLPPRQTSDLAYTVSLLYAHQVSLPSWLGTIQPEAPQVLNISVAQSFWNVFLPKSLHISSIDGNMEETVALHLTYHELQNEIGFYRKLENLSQVGKESSRKRALDNMRQQWSRLQGLIRRGSGGGSLDFRALPAASPRPAMPMNKKTKEKALFLQQKMQQLQDSLYDIEKKNKQLEMRYQKNKANQEYKQQKFEFQNRYPQNQKYRAPSRSYRRYRRYRQKGSYSPYNRKGSFLWPNMPQPPGYQPERRLHKTWQDSILKPGRQDTSLYRKPCVLPVATQVISSTSSTTPLTMTQNGLQYAFVAVGGKPKLKLQLYRRDRVYAFIHTGLWILLCLVVFFAWKRRWFSRS